MIKKLDKYTYVGGTRYMDNGSRNYDVAGYRLPSVTTILSRTKDDTFLKKWIADKGKKEAERIKFKHLITLEIITSKNKMEQISKNNICLVQPKSLQRSSNVETKLEIITLSDFIEHLRNIQK